MTTAIELADRRRVELSYLQTVGTVLAESHYFSDAHTAQQAVAKILAGQEFGMGVMEAMRSFHVIDGKVEMSADAQARLVKQSDRYDYDVIELTDEKCSIGFFDADGGDIGTSTFTIADAERAGIVKNEGAWKKYPRNMLFARAMTNGIAWFCPDAISGGRVYAPGEISGEAWEVPAELEPARGSAIESLDGMGNAGGPSTNDDTGGDGPTSGSHAVREGASGSQGDGGSAPSPASSDEEVPSPESEGEPSSAPAASEDTSALRGTEGEAVSSSAEPTPRILSSQTKQLLRHAADLRWTDTDIRAAIDEAYPGLHAVTELSQEQARALIPEWSKLVKATRITPEQKERLKPLATNGDIVRHAQVLFGADHVKNVADLTNEEAERVITSLMAQREGAA